jgi:Raf kinase inhibitor-like YbhB/YbcL family protein
MPWLNAGFMRRIVFFLAGGLFLSVGSLCMALEIKSSAFEPNARLAKEFTCEGPNLSPPLSWQGAPPETVSFALICDDPDAPAHIWVHWVIYNIPASATGLPKGVRDSEVLPDGSRQGRNDSGTIGYSGPYPPPGRPHRYYFKLYALDTMLTPDPQATKESLLGKMKGHVLAEASTMGTYQR